MKKLLHLILLMIASYYSSFAQVPPAHVGAGDEYPIYNAFDLSAYGGVWATDRSPVQYGEVTPGFYSASASTTYNGYFINASNAHHINGYVKRYGTGLFTFPVGTGTELRYLSISAPSFANATLATAWIPGDPNTTIDPTGPNPGVHPRNQLGANVLAVSPVGEWDWIDFNNTSPGITITVSIPDMTGFALASNLRLVGWNGWFWTNLSAFPTATGNTAGSELSGTMINGITAIGIASTSTVLDVTLADFSVSSQNCNGILNWTTTHEDGTSVFYIEQSNDGVSFNKAGQEQAIYNGIGGSYHFNIPQSNSLAPLYYRLKIVSNNGTTRYSSIKQFNNSCGLIGNFMELTPNPITAGTAATRLRFRTRYQGKATLLLVNNIGQNLIQQNVSVTTGDNTISIGTNNIASGTYYLLLKDQNGQLLGNVQKLIKQ